MSTTFFIEDRFNITGRGMVYCGKIFPRNASVHLGDFLYDSAGNTFEVKGIEMFRRVLVDYDDPFDYPVGFLLKNEDGLQVQGDIMTDGTFEFNYLFCNHPLYQRKPDEDYEAEYIAAQDNGNSVALFSYEDLEQGKLSLYGDKIEGLTIYRGWMMKPEMYRTFYEQCKKNDIILINDPTRYEECHLLPNWYDKVFPNTARSVWTEGDDVAKAIALLGEFGTDAIVKDFVKIVSLDDLAKNDYTLAVNTYVEKTEAAAIDPKEVRKSFAAALAEVRESEAALEKILAEGGLVHE